MEELKKKEVICRFHDLIKYINSSLRLLDLLTLNDGNRCEKVKLHKNELNAINFIIRA